MHKKARTLCFALLVGLVCCSCTKTIPYDPNPSKVSGDPFQELERSLQREGMYTPAILEIGP